ncbi:MAG TPA: hypothetical protein ENJ18_14325 [Nannocystis exedens]|nr:hypothetical protein [Nannocystis exedens]
MARATRLLLILGAACTLACAPPEATKIALQTLYFAPNQTTRSLEIRNPSDEALPLTRIRLDTTTADWGSFVITDERLPPSIPAGGSVELHLRADNKHFNDEHRRGKPPHYRSGRARLLFRAGGPRSVDLHFEPKAGDGLWILLTKLGIFAALAGSLAIIVRRRREPVPWLLLLLLALLPWGPALCPATFGQVTSESAVAQCAAGFEGTSLTLSAPTGGLLLLFALLLGSDLLRGTAALHTPRRAGDPRPEIRHLICDLSFAIAAAGALIASATLDLAMLVDHQRGLEWGVQAQPVAAIIALLALLLRSPPADRCSLDDLALASIYCLVFLAGWTLPGQSAAIAILPHGAFIALGILSGLAKIAALTLLIGFLRRRSTRRQEPGRLLQWLPLLAIAELLWQGFSLLA